NLSGVDIDVTGRDLSVTRLVDLGELELERPAACGRPDTSELGDCVCCVGHERDHGHLLVGVSLEEASNHVADRRSAGDALTVKRIPEACVGSIEGENALKRFRVV